MPHTWPLEISHGPLRLRPLQRRDRRAFEAMRRRNIDWLGPWNASDPHGAEGTDPRETVPRFHRLRRIAQEQGRSGWSLHLMIEAHGELIGQAAASPILYGSMSTAVLGYWIDERSAGRGYAPYAAALLIDHCFTELGLHRVEANVRPENAASLRVMEKLHFRHEGRRLRSIHVQGAFRDHESFALTREEVPPHREGRGALARLISEHPLREPPPHI